MFVALDQFGNKLNPIDVDEEELRLLSKSKLLFCPECESLVRFASGEKVTAHFKHVKITDCNYDSEPETEEHLKGKKLIREWLLNRYPQAKVEFEYKITETNQRADVFASFPNGRKIAFEMQCSKIQGSVWKERHALYKRAGIQDIWILGNSVHKYGKTEGEIDYEKHQLVSLASTIYEEEGVLYFLDTTKETIKGSYMHKFKSRHSDTIFLFEEETYPLKNSKVFKQHIGTDSIRSDFGIWHQNKLKGEQLQKEKEEEEKREEARRKIEEEKRIKEEERYFRMLEKRQKRYLFELKTFSLEQVKKKMTRNERNLFEKLIKKHAFNDENFPGIFNVYTKCNYLIQTPSPLWQLLIYDYYIYRKFEPYDKVWIPKIKDKFYKLRQQGVLRFKYRDNKNHFTFAIYNYFNKLNNIGIVIKLGFNNVKYQKILANQLPLHSGKNTHKCGFYNK